MRHQARSAGGWIAAACLLATAFWACSGSDTNPFGNGRRQQGGSGGTSGASVGGTAGTSAGTDSGSSGSGGASGTSGTSGASTGGEATGGMTTGGGTGDGGESGETGGSTTGGSTATGGAGAGGNAGTPAMGGAGMSGSPMGGAGASAGAGMGGAGMAGGGMSGTGGMPGQCQETTDCDSGEWCRKESCDAEFGLCEERGGGCIEEDAVFDPVCGCDGITYWNLCVIENEGFNVAMPGECTGNNRPTCTRTGGGDSCPERLHAHCYRPVEVCGDPSPTTGVCWVLPTECPPNEPQTQRYCGGTAGEMRCIGLCEVISDENSFRRDAPVCN